MSDNEWICSPPDGKPKVEACITPNGLVLCYWYCESVARKLEKELRALGIKLHKQFDGPCTHEQKGKA